MSVTEPYYKEIWITGFILVAILENGRHLEFWLSIICPATNADNPHTITDISQIIVVFWYGWSGELCHIF